MWYWRFLPAPSLNGVVILSSLFIRSLIGSTRRIWSVVYNNTKWIYASETLACTISDCAIVRNVLHATSTYLFITLCSGCDNIKIALQVWHYSLNSVDVNCIPASAEIISKSHHPNLSIFRNLHWNISRLSITSSVETFPTPLNFRVFEYTSTIKRYLENVVSLVKLFGSVDGIRSIKPTWRLLLAWVDF